MNIQEKQENKHENEGFSVEGNKVRCLTCGTVLSLKNIKMHYQSKKHLDAKYIMYEKFKFI